MGHFCNNKIKWFPLIILRIIFHRAFKLHMLISLGKNMTPIDFGFTRSTVKVTRVFFVKQWFLLIILRNIYHRAVIFHMLLGLGNAMTPYDFWFTRFKVKVTRSLVKNMYTRFLIIILRTIYHIAFIFYMLISLDRDLTHIDIEVIRSKVKVERITFVKLVLPHYLENCLPQRFHISHTYWS